MRNVIGREDLITCGRTNELAHTVRTECSCDSFMADRMGLDSIMLHYLAVRKAMVSVLEATESWAGPGNEAKKLLGIENYFRYTCIY